MYRRLRRAGAGAADPPHRLSRGRRLGRGDARDGATIRDAAEQDRRAAGARDRAVGRADRQGQSPPFHEEGDFRAAGGDRRHAQRISIRRRAASHCRICRSISPRCRRSPSSPAAPPITPASSPNTGSSRSRASRSRSISPRSSAIARRRCRKGGLAVFISQSGETADTLAACAMRKAQGQHIVASSTSRKARSRAKATWCSAPTPGRRSASPRPRPSRRSSPCSPASPSRWRGRAARSTRRARRRSRRR